MANNFVDPSDYEEVAQEPAATAQNTPAAIDMSQYEEIPAYADGLDKTRPLNTSPLSISERFDLGFANEKGKMDYLKKRFSAVEKDADGDLIVQDKDKNWYRLDPSNFGDTDAWTATKGVMKALGAAGAALTGQTELAKYLLKDDQVAQGVARTAGSLGLLTVGMEEKAKKFAEANPVSKELFSEYAENSPGIAKAGVSAVAGLATGGGSAIAQIGAAGLSGFGADLVESSFGRLKGTYIATEEEQLKDAALEGVLNAAGVTFTLAAKPTALMVGRRLKELSDASGLSWLGGKSAAGFRKVYGAVVGEENIDTLAQFGKRVGDKMVRFGGKTDEAFKASLKRDSLQWVDEVASASDEMLGEVYRAQRAQILKEIPENFTASVDDIVNGVYNSALKNNFVKVVGARGKEMSQMEAAELLAKTGGKLPEGYKFAARSHEELKQIIKSTGLVKDSSLNEFDSAAYGALQKFFDQVGEMREVKQLKGKAAANQLLAINKKLDDLTFALKDEVPGASDIMAAYHESIRGAVNQKFDAVVGKGAFSGMQQAYHEMKRELMPLLKAQAKHAKDVTAYEPFLNKLTTRAGRNQSTKDAFDNALALAEKYGSKQVQRIRAAQNELLINQAAEVFNPLTGSKLINSPRIPYAAIRGFQQGKEFLSKLDVDQRKAFLGNEHLVNGFASTIVQTPFIQEQVKQRLTGGGQK